MCGAFGAFAIRGDRTETQTELAEGFPRLTSTSAYPFAPVFRIVSVVTALTHRFQVGPIVVRLIVIPVCNRQQTESTAPHDRPVLVHTPAVVRLATFALALAPPTRPAEPDPVGDRWPLWAI